MAEEDGTTHIKLFDRVALARDLPEEQLRQGDVTVVIDRLSGLDVEDGYVLEVFNALGETLKVVDVPVSAVVPLRGDEIVTVRSLVPAG